jgi:outer membrane lipoprotein-sorting protein
MVWIVGWAVWFNGPAHAYVLSGPHILELMISKYGKARRLLISQTQTVFTPDAPAAGIELKETVRYVFPEIFRSDLRSQNSRRIHVVTKHEDLTAIDGKIVNEPEDEFDRYKDIFLYHSREILHQKLDWLGVNVTQASLGRFQDKIAFVLGAQYPDETRSQLWVEKETFRPMRWLMVKTTSTGQPTVLEIQYLNWQLFADNWYPVQITFIENGRLIREIKVAGVQVNTNFSKDLFDIQQLKKRFQPAEAAAPEPPGNEGMGEIEKTIKEFKKIYE